MSDLLCRAGERVTCEAGHFVADVLHDVRADDVTSVAPFGNWATDRAPYDGESMDAVVCRCGQLFVRGFGRIAQIHIEGEWRP